MKMRPLPFAAAVAVIATALSARSRAREPLHVGVADGTAFPGLLDATPCPAGRLPDGDACVHLPSDDDDSPDAPVTQNAHYERSGHYAIYDQIPRRPDRPADYDAYRYPVPPGVAGGHYVLSGYDLDRPDRSQRRGWTLHAVGHGGVDLPDPKGTPIALVALEHQQGDADVVYAGPLFGTTVVTRQTIHEAGQLRDYLVLYGHMDRISPGISAGSRVHEGDVIGFVGDTGSPELVHLHLETRRVRDGVDVTKQYAGNLLAGAVSVVCDPRNVLQLRDEKK
jgi:murein DD-endopeptidase MepM/ murein hydrolase activator NlpD